MNPKNVNALTICPFHPFDLSLALDGEGAPAAAKFDRDCPSSDTRLMRSAKDSNGERLFDRSTTRLPLSLFPFRSSNHYLLTELLEQAMK